MESEVAEQTGPEGRRSALVVIYVTVLLDLMGFGIILPFLPYWARDLGASGFGLGVILTSYSAAQLGGAAIFGQLSDRIGRRPVILLTLTGSSLAMVASGLAPSLLLLALARALAGLFGGSISAAQAYIADVTQPKERARFMGLLGASIGIGFVLGPALGGGLSFFGLGFRATAMVAAGLSAANLVSAAIFLREPTKHRPRSRRGVFGIWSGALRRPALGSALFSTFLITVAFVTMETTFPYFAQDRWDMGTRGFALTMVGLGLVLVMVQGGLIGPLTRSFPLLSVTLAGVGLMATALFLLPFGASLWTAIGILALLAVGRGLASPTLSTLLSHLSPADEQGAVLGLGQSLAAGARAVGPIAAGSLYDLHQSLPYVMAGVACVLALLLLRGPARALS